MFHLFVHHQPITRPFRITVLVAAALAGSIASASAAGHAGAVHGRDLLLAAPPPLPPIAGTMPTGINTCCHNEAGVPDTSTPGLIGTGALPSGLRGDSTSAPGFPAVVGQ